MNYSTALFLISDKVRAIACIYENDDRAKRTTFKTMDPTIAIDDYVVVETTTRHNMTVVKVVAVDLDLDVETSEEIRWIISTINLETFAATRAQEEDAINRIKSAEKRRKRAELRRNLIADADEELKALPIADATRVDG